MRKARTNIGRWPRAAALSVAVGASALLAGCENFMEVSNPGAIEEPALENVKYVNLMAAGVVGDFQPAFAWTALFSGVFADELVNHHSYYQNVEIERRSIASTNGTYSLAVYNGLHRSRFLADSVATRMTVLLADSAGRDLRLAGVLAYSGYTWTFLGEQMCESPINGSAPIPSEQMLQTAVQRFDRAIEVAQAARAHAGSLTDAKLRALRVSRADSITNFARVGAARALLWVGKGSEAMTYAKAVAPAYASESSKGFEFHAQYRDGASFGERRRVGNPFWEFVTAGRWFSISNSPFEKLDDPRVPHSTTLYTLADRTKGYVANSPSAFSTYGGTVEGKPFAATSSIRVASALEARYIVAEVEGLNPANLEFVNQRRAVGGQEALPATTTAEEYGAALRDQRRRDLFLDGHRMGDLRRYKKQGVNDPLHQFPTGADYGDQECWPIPISDLN